MLEKFSNIVSISNKSDMLRFISYFCFLPISSEIGLERCYILAPSDFNLPVESSTDASDFQPILEWKNMHNWWNLIELCGLYCRETKLATPKCLFGMQIISNSCPSHRRCHLTISSSVIPFSSCLQSFPASGSFPMSRFFESGGQILEFQLQHQS